MYGNHCDMCGESGKTSDLVYVGDEYLEGVEYVCNECWQELLDMGEISNIETNEHDDEIIEKLYQNKEFQALIGILEQ